MDKAICKECGRSYWPGLYPNGYCPECNGDRIAQDELEDGATEFTGEDEIRCPWCGKRVWHDSDDSALYESGDEECPHCGKKYWVDVETRYTYDTRRLEEL